MNNSKNKKTIVFTISVVIIAAAVASLSQPLLASTNQIWGIGEEETTESDEGTETTEGKFVLVKGAQDDIFPKLKEAAELKVVTANMVRCLQEDNTVAWGDINWFDIESVSKGYVLSSGWDWSIGDWEIIGMGKKVVTLWLENLIKQKAPEKTEGWFRCSDGKDIASSDPTGSWRKFTGLFTVWAKYLGRDNDYGSLICYRSNMGNWRPGLFERWLEGWSSGLARDDENCNRVDYNPRSENHADEDGETPCDWDAPGIEGLLCSGEAKYRPNRTDPDQMEMLARHYERYVEEDSMDYQEMGGFFDGNPFLAPFNREDPKKMGSYTNVDGYFNYMRDFNLRCSAKVTQEEPTNPTGTVREVTKFEQDIKDGRIIRVKTRYYEIRKGQNYEWTGYLGEAPTNQCSKLLDRMEYLRKTPNGIDNVYSGAQDSRSHRDEKSNLIKYRTSEDWNELAEETKEYGYEGIILSILQDTCDHMVDQATGLPNAYEAEWQALLAFIARKDLPQDDPEYVPEDDPYMIMAMNDLEILKPYHDEGHYMEVSGEEHEINGKVYQCLQLDTMEIDLATYTPPSTGIDPSEDDNWTKDPNCYSKAGVLGWILCPIIDGLRTFIIEKYEQWVEPALQIDATLFRAGESNILNGTYIAWGVFRDIGNLLFIILFIIVIFSQVTGAGIDNYGIKRIMPKMFVAAVLINMSFLICQVAVDVGNITGRQIGQFLYTVTNKYVKRPRMLYIEGETVRRNDDESWNDVDTWGESFNQNKLGNTAVIILVAALATAAVLSKGLAIIIPVLMAVLGVAISVIGLIVILGIRQAAAVLLVVASPLAFACYMLPNTKKIFDKWFDAFKGLLVAFPVCSMVIYGSDMAATILMNVADGQTWIIIAAAAISIMPIFVIPKVIRQSVGAISNGIASFSNRTSRVARGRARNRLEASKLGDRERYNKYMRDQKQSQGYGAYSARKGRSVVKKYNAKMKKGQVLNRGQQRVYNAALGAVNQQNRLNAQASASAFSGKDDAAIVGELKNSLGKGKLDADMISSALTSMRSEAQVTKTLSEMSKTKEWQDMINNDPQARARIAAAMSSRKGSVINQSIGKLMNKGMDVKDIFDNDAAALRKKVQEVPEEQMVGQDASTFDTEGAADLFSDGQLRTILSSNYTGQGAESVYGMMSGVSDSRKRTIAAHMTDGQVSKLNTSVNENGEDHGSFAALGGTKSFKDKDGNYDPSVKNLNSSAGEHLRANMSGTVMQQLEIDGSGKTARAIRTSGNKDTISGDIDLNNMSEDDYQYIKWQHEHNSGNGAK